MVEKVVQVEKVLLEDTKRIEVAERTPLESETWDEEVWAGAA